MNRRTLAATLLAALGGVLLFAWGRSSAAGESPSVDHVERARQLRSDDAASEQLAALGSAAPRVDAHAELEHTPLSSGDDTFAGLSNPRVGTLRELCEEFYGMPWDAVRELLSNPDVDPDQIVELYAWEQALPHVRGELLHTDAEGRNEQTRQILGWGGTQTHPSWYGGQLNPQRRELAAIDVQNLERLNDEFDSRLTDLAQAVNDLLPRCLADQFDRGDFARAPFVSAKDTRTGPRPKSEFRRALTTQGAGWTATLEFESAKYPELERLGHEIQALKRERFERLRDYIASL